MAENLDDVLSEPKDEAPVVETPETPDGARKAFQEKERAAQEEGRQRNPDGTFAQKEATEEPAPEVKEPVREQLTQKERALLQAAQAERHKRQELERELIALRQPTAEPAPTFWEAPDQHMEAFRAEVQQEIITTRLNTAESIARSRHPDFDEKVQAFGQVLMNTPGVKEQWLSHPDPAEFAYQVGNNHMQLRAAGGMDQLLKQREAEIRTRVEAEFKAKQEAERRSRDAIPDSLSDARGTSGHRVAWGGPTPLDNILDVKS